MHRTTTSPAVTITTRVLLAVVTCFLALLAIAAITPDHTPTPTPTAVTSSTVGPVDTVATVHTSHTCWIEYKTVADGGDEVIDGNPATMPAGAKRIACEDTQIVQSEADKAYRAAGGQ